MNHHGGAPQLVLLQGHSDEGEEGQGVGGITSGRPACELELGHLADIPLPAETLTRDVEGPDGEVGEALCAVETNVHVSVLRLVLGPILVTDNLGRRESNVTKM